MKNEVQLSMKVGTGIGQLARKYLRAPIIVIGVALPVAHFFPDMFVWIGLVVGVVVGVFVLRWYNKRWPEEPVQASVAAASDIQTAAGLVSFAVLVGDAFKSMDDVPPLAIGGSGPTPVRAVRKWQDGTGKVIEVAADGRLTYAGKFVGYRDAQGRITNGSGTFVGTLKDSGELHAANGDFKGRVFG